MKKLIVFLLIGVTIFFIYLCTLDKKIYFLALGDSIATGIDNEEKLTNAYTTHVTAYLEKKGVLERTVTEFIQNNYRSIDLTNAIKENREVVIGNKKTKIQNALIKADLTTVSIGLNDYLYYLNTSKRNMYNNFVTIASDIKVLTELIRQYTKEKVIFVGIYNPYLTHDNFKIIDENLKILNDNLRAICENENIYYVDIYKEMQSSYHLSASSIYPTEKGYILIYNKIKQVLEYE